MIRLGVKLTHDGGLALLDGTSLVFSHEAEKSANNARHSELSALDVRATLAEYGCTLAEVDRVVVDGWVDGVAATIVDGARVDVAVAPYQEVGRDPLEALEGDRLPLGGELLPYTSYTHAAGHLIGTYATSPWAAAREPAAVLVWDGGMLPRLYTFDGRENELRFLRPLFGFVGHVYPIFASFFDPFVPAETVDRRISFLPGEPGSALELPGKVMAYVALGNVDEDLFALFDSVYRELLELRWEFAFTFSEEVSRRLEGSSTRHADVLASFQAYLGRLLVDGVTKTLERRIEPPYRLCFTGGCALNIAWNASLRATGLFEDVWVPPFPNDAGSALGAAAADLVRSGEGCALEWDVYRGPALVASAAMPDWRRQPCGVDDLAALLHETGEPVVVLHGRAELGPRALGNRSILCAATEPSTKDCLNGIKQRDWYRPVAPICLTSEAPKVFDPGAEDPYMLFAHDVRPEWNERIPAVVHLDGSARLQTIDRRRNAFIGALLERYHELSGIPLLCNTSANLKGSGFFPDVRSAMEWGGTTYVWSDGTLYARVAEPAAAYGGVPSPSQRANSSTLSAGHS